MGKAAILGILALALSGCAGTADPNTPAGRTQIQNEASETAKRLADLGKPCDAADLEPAVAKYGEDCTQQKNHDARVKEAEHEKELLREAARLQSEGKTE